MIPGAFVVDAVRSPIGRRNGSLAGVRADDLAAQVLNGLVSRVDVDPARIDDVQMGCVTQVGEQGWNVGRMAVLAAGWPVAVAATTVDRQCGSSLQACFNAASAVAAGQLDLVIAAGVESMSRVAMGSNGGSVSARVTDRYELVGQGTSAELLAAEWGLARDELDAYALESHRRAVAAIDGGRFEREIVTVELPAEDGGPGRFAVDETPRRDTSAEALAALPPAFDPGGVVTAGNSSQIVDGAAAVLIAGERAVTAQRLEPRARFVSFGLAGVDPTRMLHGNPQAMTRALERARLTLDDMAVVEVNEAFASVVLQTVHDLGLGDRLEDVNPNGGGISLGHPLGATGARIVTTLVGELERRDSRYGIASMCVGFGMAIAAVVERL